MKKTALFFESMSLITNVFEDDVLLKVWYIMYTEVMLRLDCSPFTEDELGLRDLVQAVSLEEYSGE
jgi:hypothetical protein